MEEMLARAAFEVAGAIRETAAAFARHWPSAEAWLETAGFDTDRLTRPGSSAPWQDRPGADRVDA